MSAMVAFNTPTTAALAVSVRVTGAPVGDDARIDMTEASAWIGQDLVKARAAANAAVAKGRAQRRPLLVARTYGFLCQQGVGIGASMQKALCSTLLQFYVDHPATK